MYKKWKNEEEDRGRRYGKAHQQTIKIIIYIHSEYVKFPPHPPQQQQQQNSLIVDKKMFIVTFLPSIFYFFFCELCTVLVPYFIVVDIVVVMMIIAQKYNFIICMFNVLENAFFTFPIFLSFFFDVISIICGIMLRYILIDHKHN